MRDININVSCAHCGELLDTNEATRHDIDDHGQLDLSLMEFHVGRFHECFEKGGRNEVEEIEDKSAQEAD
jgi:hypothetical protein